MYTIDESVNREIAGARKQIANLRTTLYYIEDHLARIDQAVQH